MAAIRPAKPTGDVQKQHRGRKGLHPNHKIEDTEPSTAAIAPSGGDRSKSGICAGAELRRAAAAGRRLIDVMGRADCQTPDAAQGETRPDPRRLG
ncbi:hypothetical protein GGTG_12439 [Gaeumannomyces tritici R3-111a-1]|uniref:Uncharacterized protein n=1 Tax=Gaeumannomyces tritici (strain R3-111a-1) TaxID=644352 RepID=J3PG13_GAET3|nr:hypothetical protein GGTG_12439 [Gaeumannomyces tritici R3-111a-1]EJT70266.1 hypothetical protein GGTG_12439 [Gaeumannomyces tritici R3-111a-1]